MSPILFVTLAVLFVGTVTLAYVAGRSRRMRYEAPVLMGRKDLRQAEGVADDLLGTVRRLQGFLSTHEVAVTRFKQRLNQLRSIDNTIEISQVAEEAERLLEPTTGVAARMIEAFDKLRLHTNILRSYRDLQYDPLTGLKSRRALNETLRLAFQLILRKQERALVVVVCDIDAFGKLNQRLGHNYGDRMLKAVSLVFAQCVRETDVVARCGGNEFAIVLPDADIDDAAVLSERIRARIGQELPFTVSIGIATAMQGDTPPTLLARADAALTAAKAKGGDRVFLHDGDGIEVVECEQHSDDGSDPECESADELLEEMILASDEPSLADVLTYQDTESTSEVVKQLD